jgi:ribonucleotide reductase beta subunit family protein with ferritin-like domain
MLGFHARVPPLSMLDVAHASDDFSRSVVADAILKENNNYYFDIYRETSAQQRASASRSYTIEIQIVIANNFVCSFAGNFTLRRQKNSART